MGKNNFNFQTKQKLIMEHYQNPIFFRKNLNNFQNKISHFSNYCIDELHIGFEWEENVLKDIFWNGQGCAIFKSSTDLFIESIINKKYSEIEEITFNYEKMIFNKKYNNKILDKLNIFFDVNSKFKRLHCAEMILIVIKKILNQKNNHNL